MEINDLFDGYKKFLQSETYQNYLRNKDLFDGKSSDVFYDDVIQRVKLEYMGVITAQNEYLSIVRHSCGKGFQVELKPFKPLIVGNNILGAVTKLYAELGSNSEPTITLQEKEKKILTQIDFQEKTEEAISIQSYGGKLLVKGSIKDEELYIELIEPNQFFDVKKNGIIEGYVIFNVTKNIMTAEIYTKGQTEYRQFEIHNNELKELPYPNDLTQYGAIQDGLGYLKTYDNWQVAEVKNIFRRSDYVQDLVILNRELVIGDTLTSQAFDKVANPLLQIPESALEYDEDGNLTLNIKDRLLIVSAEDKELKQVALETKTAEWNLHRTNIVEEIYRNTGTNEQAFGLNKNGVASGEAKRRDLERTLSTVLAKRDKVFAAFEKILKWGNKVLYGNDLEVTITGKDILTLGVTEKINIVVQAIASGIMSVESAIKYLNISSIDTKEEIKKIKMDITYKQKVVEALQLLENISSDNRVAGLIKTQADELMKELGLNEEEDKPISS